MINQFPLFVSLSDKKIIMIGGGKIATRRVKALISFTEKITVIAPEISEDLMKLSNTISIIQREFIEEDINGAYLVFAATNNRSVNKKIGNLCRQNNVLVNVCDNKDECDFYFPALFFDENVLGGLVSINGNNHRLVKEKAKEIRRFLKRGEDFEDN